ncbi:MAG: M14 family metallopeptidase [Longimicrobiales bacterium]
MKKLIPIVAVLVLSGCRPGDQAASTPEAPDLSDVLTRAEATDFHETSTYADVVEMAEDLDAAGDRVHLTWWGTTTEGRELPLLVVGADGATPEDVLATGKLRVYLQGNIHGGEVPGKEALLMLVRDWIQGAYPDWTEELVLLIAPIYNADGNERVALTNRPRQHGPLGGMGQRPNAQGLDLNRDHMKLGSPEAQALVGMLNAYDPHLGVDLHTTNGTRHGYHLTYAPSLHPDTHEGLNTLLREELFPAVTAAIEQEHGWHYYFYGNAYGDPVAWRTFDHRPRFNNNYVGLRNRVAILSEAYSYLTFEDRVFSTLYFVEEILDYANGHSAEIRAAVETADATSVVGETLSTRSVPERSAEPVTILMGQAEELQHPESGEPILLRQDTLIPTQMYEFGTFQAQETEVAPAAYLVPPDLTEVIERIHLHGIETFTLEDGRGVAGEAFFVDSTRAAEEPFQQRNERRVWGEYRPVERSVEPGTVVVPVDQPLGRLAFHLLEPNADDGFTNWAYLDPWIEAGEWHPVWRTREPVAR